MSKETTVLKQTQMVTYLFPASDSIQGASPAGSRNRFQKKRYFIGSRTRKSLQKTSYGLAWVYRKTASGEWMEGEGGRGEEKRELTSLVVRTRQVPLESVR